MMRPNRRRLGPIFAAVGLGLVLLTSPVWATRVALRIEWLNVRHIEISGTMLLTPDEVLAASGIRAGDHLMDEVEDWENSLLTHPVIDSVRISRRPPHTIRIEVVEKRPVGLIAGDTLRYATASGEVLPIDPHRVPLDLPIFHVDLVHDDDDEEARGRAAAALAEIHRLTTIAPALMADVSEVSLAAGTDGDALRLAHSEADLFVPFGMTPIRIDELRSVMADLRARATLEGGEAGHGRRHYLDLRFDDQIVARPSYSRERS